MTTYEQDKESDPVLTNATDDPPTHVVKVVKTGSGYRVTPGVLPIKEKDVVHIVTAGPKLRISFITSDLLGERLMVSEDGRPAEVRIPRLQNGIYPYVVLVEDEERLTQAEGSTLPVFLVEY